MAEQDPREIQVEVEYFTPGRMGERYGVSLFDALAQHPDARIMRYADGQPFEGKEAKAEVREARAELKAEAQSEPTEPVKAKARGAGEDAKA